MAVAKETPDTAATLTLGLDSQQPELDLQDSQGQPDMFAPGRSVEDFAVGDCAEAEAEAGSFAEGGEQAEEERLTDDEIVEPQSLDPKAPSHTDKQAPPPSAAPTKTDKAVKDETSAKNEKQVEPGAAPAPLPSVESAKRKRESLETTSPGQKAVCSEEEPTGNEKKQATSSKGGQKDPLGV